MAYSDKVVDHYENPRNVGSFDKGDDSVGTGMVGAPACGDVMKLQIKVNPETGVIEDARFKTYGCGSAIASSSLVTEWVKGKTLDDIDRPQLVVCSVDLDHDKAIDTTRGLLTQYLAQQPHIAKASGVSMDVVAEIQSILGWPATHEQIDKAKHLVPEDLIYRITASGTPEEARKKVDEYRKNGCTCPILYPVGGDVKLLIDTFAE